MTLAREPRRESPPAAWDPPLIAFCFEQLPPLPPLSADGRALATAHKSSLEHVRPHDKHDALDIERRCNRHVEWLGDNVLGWFVALIVEERWPDSPSSTVTQLTCNTQLAHLGWAYGLDQSLVRGDRNPGLEVLSMKMVADAFEAHIGVLYREATAGGRVEEVEAFVRDLHSEAVYPTLAEYGSSLDDFWATYVTNAANAANGPAVAFVPPADTRAEPVRQAEHDVPSFFDARGAPVGTWTSELRYGDRVLGRGRATKRWNARLLAVEDSWGRRTPAQLEAFAAGGVDAG
ncbi:hypothetical protein JCM8208_004843 [Rhodotorula glutinis]